MTNQEILEKAIQKVIERGWNPLGNRTAQDLAEKGVKGQYPLIIFNHDFARALWGEDTVVPDLPDDGDVVRLVATIFRLTLPEKRWQARLQQMVIADDPIKYLGEHL